MQLIIMASLLISLVIAILAVQNPTIVSVRFLFWELPQTSLVVLILGSALGGGLIVLILDLVRFWRLGLRLKQYAAENQELKVQIDRLVNEQSSRSAPIP